MRSWSTKELFEKLQELEKELGEEPSRNDVQRKNSESKGKSKSEGGFPAVDTFVKRFDEGRIWEDVLDKYRNWKRTGDIPEDDEKDSERSLAQKMRDERR